jgi:predicted acetyltransferase
MPTLAVPTSHVHRSFVAAMAEFAAEGRGPGDGTMIGYDLAHFGDSWQSPEGFASYVRQVLDQVREDAPRPDHFVPSTTLWWIEGEEYLGRLAIRHRLTPALLEAGGHIGYDVRASVRRRGHATAMLAAGLPVAHRLGIDPALITCEANNVASRRVIEHNGGIFEDERGGKLRFWTPTA